MAGPKTLLKAVTSGRTRQVRLLLDLGASTEDVDECGQTPLIRAIFVDNDRNRDKMVKMLLKKGSLVSKADVVGRSALSWACMYGRDKEVAMLLEYADVDLDLNKTDINGQTALFHAVSSGNAATVKLIVNALQKYAMSVDIPDCSGVSPLMHADRLGYDICASILIHEGSATVGLCQHNNEKQTRSEKWAISSLRERSRAKNLNRQSQFPPITNKPDDASLKSRNNRKYRHVGKIRSNIGYDSDSSSDGEYEDSLFLGHQNVLCSDSGTSPRVNTNVRNCLQHVPPCNIPISILKSSTMSSLLNVSSDNDSEVDSVASTIVEGRPVVKTTVDLPSMYEYYTEQMSTSFRQPARKLPEKHPELPACNTEGEVDADSEDTLKEKELKDLSVQRWSKLKKNIRMTGLTKINKLKSAIKAESSPRNNEITKTATRINIIASLPDIYVERKDQ